MTEKEIIKQLKSLKNHKEAGALNKERADLMYKNLMFKIDEDLKLNPAVYSPKLWFLRGFGLNNCFRYAVTICMVFIIGITGSLTTVSAALNSLPGDTLYTIKLATEKVQLALTQGEAMKINLRTEFVGRRIDEMAQIVESSLEDKGERIEQALSNFEVEINNVNNSLKSSNEQGGMNTVAISQKIGELNDIIILNALDLPDEIMTISDDINNIMDIMIETGMSIDDAKSEILNPKSETNPQPVASTSSHSIFIEDTEIPEAPKKIQWQIIIEE